MYEAELVKLDELSYLALVVYVEYQEEAWVSIDDLSTMNQFRVDRQEQESKACEQEAAAVAAAAAIIQQEEENAKEAEEGLRLREEQEAAFVAAAARIAEEEREKEKAKEEEERRMQEEIDRVEEGKRLQEEQAAAFAAVAALMAQEEETQKQEAEQDAKRAFEEAAAARKAEEDALKAKKVEVEAAAKEAAAAKHKASEAIAAAKKAEAEAAAAKKAEAEAAATKKAAEEKAAAQRVEEEAAEAAKVALAKKAEAEEVAWRASFDPKKWVIGPSRDGSKVGDVYVFGERLGQPGAFGEAFSVTHKTSGEVFACKVINKTKFNLSSDHAFQYEQLRNEIKLMQTFSHPNIITFNDVYEDQEAVYIVMECCTGGELFDRIKAQAKGRYSEADAAKVLSEMLSGVEYLHKAKIAHCDLKPDNFLFMTESADSQLKIIDFGMAKLVKRREYETAFAGTPFYIAPEVLELKYAEHCDMWSFGVIMFVVLFGFPPFHGADDEKIYDKIRKGFSPETKKGYGAFFPEKMPASDAAKDLIGRCLVQDPAKRLTASEALEHRWFHGDADTSPMIATVLKNLNEFTSSSTFKNAVLNMMSKDMTESEVKDIQDQFRAIDLDGNGTVTVAELQVAVSKVSGAHNASLEKIQEMMKVADLDGDGELSYDVGKMLRGFFVLSLAFFWAGGWVGGWVGLFALNFVNLLFVVCMLIGLMHWLLLARFAGADADSLKPQAEGKRRTDVEAFLQPGRRWRRDNIFARN